MIAAAAAAENVPHRVSLPESCRCFEGIPSTSLRVKRGRSLFHAGDEFSSIYPVIFGSFKTLAGDYHGRQQVTRFPLPGDVIGLDGIGSGRHTGTAVALEDSEVIVLAFANVERAARDDSRLQHALHAFMAGQIIHDHQVMMVLGTLHAAERVAAFLLSLSRSYQRLGYSPAEFYLRMGRADIGSYLGMKIETVSRMLNTFSSHGLIELHDKHIRLLDVGGLERTSRGHGLRIGREERERRLGEQARTVPAPSQSLRSRRDNALGAEV